MRTKVQYESTDDVEGIIQDYIDKGMYLVEDAKLIDGNYLVFDDQPMDPDAAKVIYVNVPQEEFVSLQQENLRLAEESNANQLALMELHTMLLSMMPDEA